MVLVSLSWIIISSLTIIVLLVFSSIIAIVFIISIIDVTTAEGKQGL